MPRPKKVVEIEEPVDVITESAVVTENSLEEEKPPTQVLIPHHITKQIDPEDLPPSNNVEEVQQESITKFAVYLDGEYVDMVDDESAELFNYLELNKKELTDRIEELYQTPNDPNDLIFFNFGEQKMIYKSYQSYFNVNGFAPVEPRIKSWMEYYLNLHNPITPEEIAIQLKGSLHYSFIPIKS